MVIFVHLQDIVVGLMTQEAVSSSETIGQSSELSNIGKLHVFVRLYL